MAYRHLIAEDSVEHMLAQLKNLVGYLDIVKGDFKIDTYYISTGDKHYPVGHRRLYSELDKVALGYQLSELTTSIQKNIK